MANTKVISGKEATDVIREGVDLVGDTVGATMGSKGRYVIINQNGKEARPTKDGVTVSTAIRPKDNRVAAVVKAIQDAAVKTVIVAGDGTTTSTVLTQVLTNLGLDLVESGSNPIDIKRGMESGKDEVIQELEDIARTVDYEDDVLRQVATVSANNDKVIGQLVFDATNKVTKDGVIRIEDSLTNETTIEVKEAFEVDSGFISTALATNAKGESNYDNPFILITDDNISSFKDIEPAIRLSMESQRPLVIIATAFTGDVPATIISNVAQSKIHVNMVKATGDGSLKKEFLDDIAALTGGNVVSKSMGKSLRDIAITDFGQAEKVISNRAKTIIEGAAGDKEAIETRIERIKADADTIKEDFIKKEMEKRASKLRGKIAIIKVGGGTELERKEIIDRLDDSLRAAKSALDEGVVPGGGITLLKLSRVRDGWLTRFFSNKSDFQKGRDAFFEALSAPIERMVSNAGLDVKTIVNRVRDFQGNNYGYNLETNEYADMFEDGIIDPKQVVRVAVESAVSVAGVLITTEKIIVDEE